MTTPTITLRKITHYLGDDKVTYNGKNGPREFTPSAYEVLVDDEVVGTVQNGTGYRETSSAGNMYVNSRWETVEWTGDFTYRSGKRGSWEYRTRTDALTAILGYGTNVTVEESGLPNLHAARALAKTARVSR